MMSGITLISLRTDFALTGEYSRFTFFRDILVENGFQVTLLSPDKSKHHNPRRAESFIGHLVEIGSVFRKTIGLRQTDTVIFILLPTPAYGFLSDLIKLFTAKTVLVYFESHLSNLLLKDLFKNVQTDFLFYLIRYLINNKWIAKCSLFKANRYIVSTEYQAKELSEIGIKKDIIEVIGNSVDIANNIYDKNQLRGKYKVNPEDQIICYIGHFFHIKGVDILLKAFSKVVSEHKNIKLILAWSGLGNKTKIAELISKLNLNDVVIELGAVIVFEVLKLSDLLVLPYRTTFGSQCPPNLIIEGIASGIPLITADLPIFREILLSNSCLFFKPDDEKDLADKIGQLLTNYILQDECRKNQLKMMELRFNKTLVSKQVADLFSK